MALTATTLEQRLATQQLEAKLQQIEAAPSDPLFLADLGEVMVAFPQADTEWWEH